MNAKNAATAIVVLLAACSAGCLSKDVTHTLTLETDGSVTWTILEADVRSAEESEDERTKEEYAYLQQALAGELPATQAMLAVGAYDVRARVLRDRPPFRVEVEGCFSSVDALFDAWRKAGLAGSPAWESVDGTQVLSLSVPSGVARSDAAEEGTPLDTVLEEMDRVKFVPASGSFRAATGLRGMDDGMLAIHEVAVPAEHPGEGLPWSLTWSPTLPTK